MRSKNLLPKFGSDKNPFVNSSNVPAQSEAQATPSSPTARYKLTPTELSAARLKETKRLPAMERCEEKVKPAESISTEASGFSFEWAEKLNPIAWWRRRKSEARPVTLKQGKAPIQGELSLEKIKVVRNDLSDADLEIVSAKPVARPRNPEPAKPEPGQKTEETAGLIKS